MSKLTDSPSTAKSETFWSNLVISIGDPRTYVPVLLLLLLLVPAFLTMGEPFYATILVNIFLSAGLAGGWNIIGGYAGQLSLGHAGFFGIGAYTAAILLVTYKITPWIGMLVGAALAGLIAAGLGYVCLRMRGPFFSLVTLAFGEVLRIAAVNLPGLTRGSQGFPIPFRPGWENLIFRGKTPYVFLTFGFMLLVFLVSVALSRSRLGYYLVAIRENEDAAEALTINSAATKITASALSGFLTAIGGVLYATFVLFLDPANEFSVESSVNMALIPMIGGLGTVAGPLLGAVLLTPIQEFLRGWLGGLSQGLHLVVYGSILILAVMFFPQGLTGMLSRPYNAIISRLPRLTRGSPAALPEDEPDEESPPVFAISHPDKVEG